MKNRLITTKNKVTERILNYISHDTEKYIDEIKQLETGAREYATGFRMFGTELMKKQTESIVKAIKWAEEMGRRNCVETNLLPEAIVKNEYETIDKCGEVDENLETYLSEIEEIHGFIKSVKESATDSVEECGSDYSQLETQDCLEDVGETYKDIMTQTYEQNLEVLREEFENLIDGQYSKLFVCIVEARSSVLKVSRLAAARVRACVFGEEIPMEFPESPPITFLQLQPPTPAYLHIVDTLDELY